MGRGIRTRDKGKRGGRRELGAAKNESGTHRHTHREREREERI